MTETTNLHLKKPENSDFVNVADLNYNSDILDETIHQIQEDIKGSIDTSAYATAISMTLNSDTYVISAFLTNKDGETLGTPQTVDLPLETMVVGGSYDDTTKKVILTLKNGNTVDFSVADLIDGLQSEITSTNKLNSDLINDTNQNNKFVTSAEKTKIANALTEEVYNAGKTTPYGTQYVIAGETYTVGRNAEIFNSYDNNKAIGEYSHAEGNRTTATGSASHAEGGALLASGTSSHAEGGGTTASGNYSHAEGSNTTASGLIAHAEGEFTNASGRNAHTEGTYTIASSNNQHVQGKYNVEDSNSKYAFIIGNGTDSNNRSNAFAIDWNGLIYVNNASTGVNIAQLQPIINSSNKINADYVDDSNSINKFVTSAEKTKIANALTEEVYNAGKTIPKGTTYVIDEVTYTAGNQAEVFNNYSNNKAAGDYSHAEGNGTMALSNLSHAEGSYTKAANSCAHSEGGNTVASGIRSHAEGSYTTASGVSTHSEGGYTTASGRVAHSEGYYTIASSDYQHSQGKFNIEDSNNKYAFIIGNGTADDNRSNAFSIDWEGKIYVNNSATGVDVSDLLARIIALENKIAALENA